MEADRQAAAPPTQPRRRRLGRSGLWVNPLGFGAMHVWSEADAETTLRAAFSAGLDFVDTSRAYGGSELALGRALTGWDKVVVASKTMSRSRDAALYDVDRSRRYLGRERLLLYQLHDVGPDDWEEVLSARGALAGLRAAQEMGRVVFVGISSHSAAVLDLAIVSGQFDTIQFAYNPFHPEAREIAAKAAAHDLGVIAMKPFGGFGMLSTLRLAEPPSSLDAALLLRYVLSDPHVSVVIPGIRFPSEVEQNLLAAQLPPLGEAERLAVEDEAASFLARMALGDRYCRGCGYCLQNDGGGACPAGIDIPRILIDFYNPHRLLGDAQSRLRARYVAYFVSHVGPEACTACGACEMKCPYGLPVVEMLRETSRLLAAGL